METGLITKDEQFIKIPYYEIGLFAENICKRYIEESEKNKIEFEMFSVKYKHFKPYLDFLLFRLGYKMINPLLREDSLWYVKNNILYNKDFCYLSVTDEDLKIRQIDPENLEECIIDFNGVAYQIDRNNGIHHEDVYELVLNQYLIYNKELYELYENYVKNDLNISGFCRNMLGFNQVVKYKDLSGYIIYCEDLENIHMEMIREEIKNIHPKIEIEKYKIHTDESLKIAQRCIEIVGEKHESRRI